MRKYFGVYLGSIIFLCAFGIGLSPLAIYAQTNDGELENVDGSISEEKDLEQQKEDAIDELKDKRDISEGAHTDDKGRKWLVAWGVGRIAAPYNHKNFINSRQIAFTKAMADAKREMVTLISQDIESNMSLIMEQPPESRAQAEADAIKADVIGIEEQKKVANAAQSDLEKKSEEYGVSVVAAGAKGVNRLYQNKLDTELKAKGIDPSKPVDPAKIKAVLNSEKFTEVTKIMARSKVVGMQAFKTFEYHPAGKNPEDRGEIGVLAIWSPKLNNLGRAIVSGDTSLIPPGAPKPPLKDQITKNNESLLMTFGVQMKKDENGAPALVSYCQAGQRGRAGKRAAIKKAKTCAAKQIRQYAGESLASTTLDQNAEEATEFEDETQAYQSEDSLDDVIKTTAASMKISGISNLHSWSTKHPVTGKTVRGAVVYWSPTAAAMAQSIGRQINAPITKASEGNNQNRDVKIKKKQPPVSRKGFSGGGSSASDDF
jgi:hypothetical protein